VTPDEFRSETPLAASRTLRERSDAESLSAVHQRRAHAEQELHVQFTRIAQLQAQLDLVLAALRRLTEGPRRR
jgi:hypothetical protein